MGAYDNIPIIGVTAGETKASFIIFDGSQLDRNWTAHTGDLCLINLYRMEIEAELTTGLSLLNCQAKGRRYRSGRVT